MFDRVEMDVIDIPGFHAAKSMKKKGLNKSPTFGVKMAFFSQYFINIHVKITTFHPLWMNFGIYRQIHIFTK